MSFNENFFLWIIVKCFNNGKYIEFYSVVEHYFFLRAAVCNSIEQICLVKLILASSLPIQEIPEFYGNWEFISVHKTWHWPLSWARWIQSLPSHIVCLRSVLIFWQYLGPCKWYFPLFPHQNSVALYKFCKYLMCEGGKDVINAHYVRTFPYYCSLYIAYIEGDDIYYYVGQ